MKKELLTYMARTGMAALVVLLAVCAGHAQSLSRYLELAAENNPALKASYAEYEAAMQRVVQQKSLQDPVFKVSALGEMVETRLGQQMASFSVEQMFPWFGTLKAKGDAAALTAEAKRRQFEAARNELFYKVKSAYYPISELDRVIQLQEKNLAILEVYKSLATAQFQNGRGPMADVLRTDIMIDELQTEIRILRDKRRPLEAAFNALLNRDSGEPVAATDSLAMPAAGPQGLKDSLQNNPQLAALDRMVEASRRQQEAARKEGMPMLGVGFNYVVIAERTDMDVPDNGKDAYMPMVSVSLPIYRKKYRARVKEAEWMETYYKARRENEVNMLSTEYEMAAFALNRAREQYRMYDHHITLAEQTIRLLLTAVRNAEADFEEVLRMRQQLLMHETAQAKVITEAWTALAKLEYLANLDANN